MNIESADINLSINHESFKTIGDDEGYFAFNAKTKQTLKMGYQKIILQLKKTQIYMKPMQLS